MTDRITNTREGYDYTVKPMLTGNKLLTEAYDPHTNTDQVKVTLDKTTLDKTALDKTALDKTALDKTAPDKSSGKGSHDVNPLTDLKSGETVAVKTNVDGKDREYLVHLPKGYDGSKPLPVYFVYHGFDSSPSAVEKITQFSAKADQENFIVVYPQGADYGHSFNNEEFPFKRKHADDVKFSQAIYDAVTKNLDVDSRKVYAVGFSNGGSFVHTLVNKMPGKFAAVADVDGWMTGKEKPSNLPISELSIHGTDDPIVPLHGTRGLSIDAGYQLTHGLFHRDIPAEKNYPYGEHLRHKLGQMGAAGFEQVIAIVERNTSFFEPTKYTTDFYRKSNNISETACVDQQGNYVSTQYLDPTTGNEVRSVIVNGLAHKWPGGPKGASITDGSGNQKTATDVIVDEFASKHQLPK